MPSCRTAFPPADDPAAGLSSITLRMFSSISGIEKTTGATVEASSSTSSTSVKALQSADLRVAASAPDLHVEKHSADSPKKSPLHRVARGRPSTSTLTYGYHTTRIIVRAPCPQ